MAPRTNRPNHTDKCREKIRVSQLINRLQDHVFGKEGKEEDEVKISATQMEAIKLLLKKTLPDLTNMEIQPLDENGNKADGFAVSIRHVKPDA